MFFKALKFAAIGLSLALLLPPVQAADPPYTISKFFGFAEKDVGKEPATNKDRAIEHLAKSIDWLEHEIDLFGTVVAKSPDVWGEARLTAHRQEFEDVLKKELALFQKDRINAAEYVSDQAFLAFALAMQSKTADAGSTVAPTITTTADATTAGVNANGNPVLNVQSTFSSPTRIFGADPASLNFGNNIRLEQTEVLDQLARYVNHLHEIRRINEGDDASDAPGYSMNLVRIPISVLPGQHTKKGYGAEITVTAEPYHGPELLTTAFRDFVINDIVDQLSVPMTRFLNDDPKETQRLMKEYDKYIDCLKTIKDFNDIRSSAHPDPLYTSEELPKGAVEKLKSEPNKLTFFDSNTLPVKNAILTPQNIAKMIEEMKYIKSTVDKERKLEFVTQLKKSDEQKASARNSVRNAQEQLKFAQDDKKQDLNMMLDAKNLELKNAEEIEQRTYSRIIDQVESHNLQKNEWNGFKLDLVEQNPGEKNARLNALSAELVIPDADISARERHAQLAMQEWSRNSTAAKVQSTIERTLKTLSEIQSTLFDVQIRTTVHVSSTTRKSTLPFPSTQLFENYGLIELAHITSRAYRSLQKDVLNRQVVHVTDLSAFLREEINAAYELMRQDSVGHWWADAASRNTALPQLIRLRRTDEIKSLRDGFISEIGSRNGDKITASLAWAIYVESLLLNERLNQDIQETLGNKPNAVCPRGWLAFFGPNPPEEARLAFNEYVRIRWPIHVFALDPVVTEQNVADVRSVYRQMQMSIALSFAQKQIGTSAALQSMRKLQRDRATIDLNRTVVGFGHGEDTFGWKFYPRFQNLPVESNATVFLRDMIIGGPTDKQLERSEELEPGMRECVAVVVMPSFVPHVTFSTRGNWFKLGCPGSTASSVSDTVRFSRVVKQMETSTAQCVQCSHLYRDGEVDRLLKRVHQLDRKLPLQTLECQVPIENTLGGFEVFCSGTRELAPELTGWYGAPAYDATRGCRLFLSGDNFSVTHSKLIIGNQEIKPEFLSRQIMQVTLPPNLAVLRDENLDKGKKELYSGYLDAHLATPYGVSGHLLIPVLRNVPTGPTTITFQPSTIRVTAQCVSAGTEEQLTDVKGFVLPPSLVLPRIDVPSNTGFNNRSVIEVRLMSYRDRDRLADIDVAFTRTNDQRGFELTHTDLNQKFGLTQSNLGWALKDHLLYLMKNKLIAPGSVVPYRISGSIVEQNGTQKYFVAPIEGEIGIEIVIEKVPAT